MQNDIKYSIIIPAYNNPSKLLECLKGIESQTISQNDFEVIVVDNGSNPPILQEHLSKSKISHITLLRENHYLNSPFSARNRGYEQAQGEVIILLDSKCYPSTQWLEKGVETLHDADIVGGDIRFRINKNSTTAELYDSFFNVQMEESILKRQNAKTGNLFIKKSVIDKIGFFIEGNRSGEDVRWTSTAVQKGFRLKFSKEAYVFYPARKFNILIRKQFRDAIGQPEFWRATQSLKVNIIKKVIFCWLPISPKKLNQKIQVSGLDISFTKRLKLLMLGWLLRIVNGFGNIIGFLTKYGDKKQ